MTRAGDREPTRLSELRDDELGGLRRALVAARREGPDTGARARIAAGVAASVNGPAHAQPPRTAPPSPFGPFALKVGLAGVAGLAAISAIVVVALRGPAREPARAAAVVPALSVTAARATAPGPVVPAERPPAPAPASASAAVVSAEPSRLAARPALPRHAGPRPAIAAPATTSRRTPAPTEGELLRRAQETLRSAPAAALALVQEHATLYPAGALAQERDVIGIEALLRLGRTEQARAAAQRFVQEHPDSPHRGHVEALMGRSVP